MLTSSTETKYAIVCRSAIRVIQVVSEAGPAHAAQPLYRDDLQPVRGLHKPLTKLDLYPSQKRLSTREQRGLELPSEVWLGGRSDDRRGCKGMRNPGHWEEIFLLNASFERRR